MLTNIGLTNIHFVQGCYGICTILICQPCNGHNTFLTIFKEHSQAHVKMVDLRRSTGLCTFLVATQTRAVRSRLDNIVVGSPIRLFAELANDLYIFNPVSLQWTIIVPEGSILPPPRVHPGFAAVAGKLYVFGGVLNCNNLAAKSFDLV